MFNQNDPVRAGLRRQALSGVAAVRVLGRHSGPADISKIARMLNNSDPMVREGTIRNLRQIGGMQAMRAIGGCLNDKDSRVRVAACKALGQLRAHPVKAQLYDMLLDSEIPVICSAAQALGQMGDKAGLPVIARLLKKKGPHQWHALRALNHITDKDFRVNEDGLWQALQWLKAKQKKRWLAL